MFLTRFLQEMPYALNFCHGTKRFKYLKYALKSQLDIQKKAIKRTSHPFFVHRVNGLHDHFKQIVFNLVTQNILYSSEVLAPFTVEDSVALTDNHHSVIAKIFWQLQITAPQSVLEK